MPPRFLLGVLGLLSLTGCAGPTLYHWGQYEDSLLVRYRDVSTEGRQRAFAMLERTIADAEQDGRKVPPGVYADFGYLLYQQNRIPDAISYFRREATAYPESRYLMDSIISRLEQRIRPPQ